jgi:GTPase SAR1 family protein
MGGEHSNASDREPGSKDGVQFPTTKPGTASEKRRPDHELLIVVRGLRRTGKTTLIMRMSGIQFSPDYLPTAVLEATEIEWKSPKGEFVKVTGWDVVEKALLPSDAFEKIEKPDATTVDTLKRADGLVIMIDSLFPDTQDLAAKVIREARDDLPVVVFSNFMDQEDRNPVIPEVLHPLMGRFYFIPGSMANNQGLIELSNWLSVALLASKKKLYWNLYKALESDLMAANVELTATAELFIELESAKTSLPKFRPPRRTTEGEECHPAEQAIEAIEAAKPEKKKGYEKPYRRRQQRMPGSGQKEKQNEPAKLPEDDVFGGNELTGGPESRIKKRRRVPGESKPSPAIEPQVAKKQKAVEEDDADPFWSSFDTGDDDVVVMPKNLKPPPVVDEVLAPNPLVVGKARAVNLSASIKSEAEKLEAQRKKEAIPQPAVIEIEFGAGDSGDGEVRDDGYGSLDDNRPSSSSDKKQAVPKAQGDRPRVKRTRFSRGKKGGDEQSNVE